MAAVTASVSSNSWRSAAGQMGARAIGLLQPPHLDTMWATEAAGPSGYATP